MLINKTNNKNYNNKYEEEGRFICRFSWWD